MPNSEIIEVGDIENELAAAGGGRLSKVGIVVGIVILAVVTIAVIRGLTVSGASTQTVTAQMNPQGDVAQDRAKVDELASYATAPKPTPAPLAAPSIATSVTQSNVTRQTHSTSSGTVSAYQQWALEEEVKAFQAPPMVRQFDDHSTLELASKTQPDTSTLRGPASPYSVMAGSVIPAVLITAINSDMPGPIIAQVSENVYDSATGQSLLIPQGSRLLGDYANATDYGQQRVRVEFKRLIFPDTSSMDLPQVPGAGPDGMGLADQINNHYLRTFATAAAIALISGGQAVGQMAAFGGGAAYGPYGYQPPSQWEMATQTMGSGAAGQLGSLGQQTVSRGLNQPPTITIRPGFRFLVILTADLVLNGPYKE
jgi:type IV secretory pathway VirB10-like protein